MTRFDNLQEFIFDAGLYAKFAIVDETPLPLFLSPYAVDGHCCYCNDRSVFQRAHTNNRWDEVSKWEDGVYFSNWHCSRDRSHVITMYINKSKGLIWKIGQNPAVADIANNAAKKYRSVLNDEDRGELSKAIGLNAHGIGVGSFVYLRRIFERLINKHFVASGMAKEEFQRLRMTDKIEALKDHLPQFLVENKNIYGILSLGIHALSEDDCRSYYPIMFESIILILEQDRQKAENEAHKKRLSAAIAGFKSPLDGATDQQKK